MPVRTRVETMVFLSVVRVLPMKIRSWLQPRYHPERHYMRGEGPACARRAGQNLAL